MSLENDPSRSESPAAIGACSVKAADALFAAPLGHLSARRSLGLWNGSKAGIGVSTILTLLTIVGYIAYLLSRE